MWFHCNWNWVCGRNSIIYLQLLLNQEVWILSTDLVSLNLQDVGEKCLKNWGAVDFRRFIVEPSLPGWMSISISIPGTPGFKFGSSFTSKDFNSACLIDRSMLHFVEVQWSTEDDMLALHYQIIYNTSLLGVHAQQVPPVRVATWKTYHKDCAVGLPGADLSQQIPSWSVWHPEFSWDPYDYFALGCFARHK